MPKRKRQPIAKFQHSRLHSPRSIRLLNLYPSSDPSAPLDVSLFETSLDEFPSEKLSYEALSYVWGALEGGVPCMCDGKELLITPNCNDALRHLRRSNQQRTFWVDAICIDQGNNLESLKERNTQITLMGEVYHTAERTLCWLGKVEQYTVGTFERLRRIGACPSKREFRKLLVYDEQLRRKGKLEPGSTCLNHIFCHSWHSRIWTLQEVAFSRDCQVICGKETISWDIYVKAAGFLILDMWIDELDAQSWKNYNSIILRDDLRRSLLSVPSEDDSERKLELLKTGLSRVRHLQATNAKDKIYGLYAVFASLNIPLPAPDYGKTLETIYEEACVAIVLHSGSLRILDYASTNARNPNLPSWVPDWQDHEVTLVNPSGTSATDGSRISQTHSSTLSPANGQLLVRGRIIGLITTRSKNHSTAIEFPSGSLPILKGERYHSIENEVDSLRLLVHRVRLFREWMCLVDDVPPPYADEDSGNLFHKLVTFHSLFSFDPAFSDPRIFNAWTDILQYPETSYDVSHGESVSVIWKSEDKAIARHWTAELSKCVVVAAALATKSASIGGQVPPEITKLLDFTAHISGEIGDRALILVHDNLLNATLPGTAFHQAMVNDSVVLLEGSDDPVVLRRMGDKWTFVGPAFVVGLMDGEAWPDDDDDIAEVLQDFILT